MAVECECPAGPPYRLVAEERGILLYMRSLGVEKRALLGMGEVYRARNTKLDRNVAVIAGCSKDGAGMSAALC